MLGILNVWAQGVVCHIEGTTTDKKTTKLFVVESGADIRTQSNVTTIPVVDGKFNYDLKSDAVRYCLLIPDNHYFSGHYRPAFLIAENQKINITMGTHEDKVVVTGTGKETKMMQQCKDELDAIYDPRLDTIESKRDSVITIFQKEIEGLSQEQQQEICKDFFSENSKNPHADDFNKYNKEYEEALTEKYIAKIKWLEEHPCLYGLFEIKSDLSQYKANEAPTTPYNLASYKSTYCNKYAGHPYHEFIKTSMMSLDLIPGNKYIDYTVTNTDGSEVPISSLYTGEIIYIDMWTSWCGPCRRHAKSLIPIYEKYKDKGFQVIGIARETVADAMTNAVKKDGYPWLCLLDLNDRNQVWLKNGINNAGGGGYLIKKDGTILAVYPEAEEAESIIKSILEK